MFKIQKDSVVTLKYKVSDRDGNVIDDGTEPLIYLHGGYEGIFQKIEDALEGKSIGDHIDIMLQPYETFGEYDADLIQIESEDSFSHPIKIGMQIEGTPEGSKDGHVYTITDIIDGKVILDGNHQLAGKILLFDGTVNGICQATDDEIKNNKFKKLNL